MDAVQRGCIWDGRCEARPQKRLLRAGPGAPHPRSATRVRHVVGPPRHPPRGTPRYASTTSATACPCRTPGVSHLRRTRAVGPDRHRHGRDPAQHVPHVRGRPPSSAAARCRWQRYADVQQKFGVVGTDMPMCSIRMAPIHSFRGLVAAKPQVSISTGCPSPQGATAHRHFSASGIASRLWARRGMVKYALRHALGAPSPLCQASGLAHACTRRPCAIPPGFGTGGLAQGRRVPCGMLKVMRVPYPRGLAHGGLPHGTCAAPSPGAVAFPGQGHEKSLRPNTGAGFSFERSGC